MIVKNVFFGILFLGAVHVNAQTAVTSAGGNATGSTGNVSFSVGQVAYTTNSGSTGTVAQGVQQPFEIQTVLGVNNFNINLQMMVYPNPATNALSLEIKDYNLNEMKYELVDLNGRLIANNKIATETTTLQLNNFPAAIYILKVLENNQVIKTFKIIKN